MAGKGRLKRRSRKDKAKKKKADDAGYQRKGNDKWQRKGSRLLSAARAKVKG